MKSQTLLYLLLSLSLLMVGCTESKEPDTPDTPDTPILDEDAIPVVFHVMWDDNPAVGTSQNPASNVFLERIGQLNKFYSGDMFPDAKSKSVDVTFALASHDPDGMALTELGINRLYYSGALEMSAEDFLLNQDLTTREKDILWDPNRYINIWLFGFTEERVTGISFLPYTTSAKPLVMLEESNWAIVNKPYYMHGIAMNNIYFSPIKNQPLIADEGMFTLCHEMGHYLGLRHAFSDSGENKYDPGCVVDTDNDSDDGCRDTPKYDRVAYNSWYEVNYKTATEEELYSRDPCDGDESFISTNVMDYYSGSRTNLTADQRTRIEHVLDYSPWIPRSNAATKALLENFTGEITDERPEPILMR